MERKNVKVNTSVKNILQDLKKTLRLKNESQVIGYLYAIYEMKYQYLTLPEDQQAREKMKEMHP